MKLAVVGRTEHLKYVSRAKLAYHLCLGSLLIDDPPYFEYYDYFHRLGHFIIVDNGAAEATAVQWPEGTPLAKKAGEMKRPGFEYVYQRARMIKADEIILPDKKFDAEWTIKHTLEAAKYVPFHMRAIVPQGETHAEWKDCLTELDKRLKGRYATICVTKDYEYQDEENKSGGRLNLLFWLTTNGFHFEHHVHLLGLQGGRADDRRYQDEVLSFRYYSWVRGLDTAAPLACAQKDVNMEIEGYVSYDWETPSINDSLADLNIERLRRWCNGSEVTSRHMP